MGALPVDNDSGNDRASVERSIHMHHEQNGGTNGNMHEEQCRNSSEEENSRSNDVTEYGNVCPSLDIQAHVGFQIQPQQPQGPQQPHGPTVLWETFLPIKTVKVLLVENDDSTRQVVNALLRNCGYEVTAVANGVQAWKTLEDPTDQIDLVLTEVVMPLLSGIGLLSRIMGHKTFKNIPVIMMSSHDSMGIVFKCLSRGAVDFLVKPIRKNELKNLWQHVWRRCHSSSGSGSESRTHTKMSKELKSDDDSETNNGSSEEQEDGSNGLSMQNGNDDGSGTQVNLHVNQKKPYMRRSSHIHTLCVVCISSSKAVILGLLVSWRHQSLVAIVPRGVWNTFPFIMFFNKEGARHN